MIYKNVEIGKNATIGEYVIIGLPPRKKADGELKTIIGKNAMIRSHTVIYAGNVIGDDLETGHGAMIREDTEIGNGVRIGTHTLIEGYSKIGSNTKIHSNAFIPEYTEIGDNVWISPNVVLANAIHPQCPKIKECLKGPTIGHGARIGANSTILPYIIIGENAFVGAGSVVTKDIPENMVAYGIPAKIIMPVSELKCSKDLIDRPYVI